MDIKTFEYQFRDVEVFQADERWFLFKKPLRLWDSDTDQEYKIKNFAELVNFDLGGKTFGELIADIDRISFSFDGTGSASSKGGHEFTFKM